VFLASTACIGGSLQIPRRAFAATPSSPSLIEFLEQTITWYHQLAVERQIASGPGDAMIASDNQQIADQVVQLAFDFARATAASTTTPGGSDQAQNQSPPSSQYQALLQLSAKLDKDVQDLQGELTSLKQKLETASGHKRQDLQSAIAETQSELELADARREAVRSMAEFVGGASTNGLGATGLRAQVEALARSVPAALAQPGTDKATDSSLSEQFRVVPDSSSPKAEPSGIWGLAADLFALSRKTHTIDKRIQQTDALSQTCNELRQPLVSTLKELSQRGDDLAKQADSAEPTALEQQKKEIDALTAQFKQTSAFALPLSKQGVLLGLYKRSLTDWQSAIRSQYDAEFKSLLARLALVAVLIAVITGLAGLWRRTVLRYVHDARRRYQLLLLRKIMVWFSIAIIIALAFASELGSVATFAGLITAGVAVALQSVILSIAGYFFLIGKFGIRVGDRVQIAGVTGEVVDIGLVRLHVMELGSGGAETPSGRVVAFPNSIVFQATAGLFKQIPGTNFVWHEITLTLSADSDYGVVEERLREAMESAFAEYRQEMERQHQQMERTLTSTSVAALGPRSRLHLTPLGLEVVIRFPVDRQHASEIDNRMTRELLKAINREPALKVVGSPSIRPGADVASS
jgi:small-conductance mechanosensitive channel